MTILKPLPTENLRPKKLGKLGRYKVLILFVLLVVGIFLWLMWSSSTAFDFVFGQAGGLKKDNGRVNVLLLGMAGGKHEGATLTDTIMVVSFNTTTKKVTLISLPRDLWIDEHKAKINTLYQTGLKKDEGLAFAKEEIGKILGLEIPYAVRLDFSGFVKAVDLVGGVDVDVKKAFDDYVYPVEGREKDLCDYTESTAEISEDQSKKLNIAPGRVKVLLDKQGNIATAAAAPGQDIGYSDQQVVDYFPCRFEHLSFKQGTTQMNGETALKFVRSRHGNNNEGTDFARSLRQQQVLQAFKTQVLSVGTLLDVQKIIGLIATFGASIDTDIPQSEYLDFIKLIKNVEEVKSFVVDSRGENPLLITPPPNVYGAWVLVPPDNNFTKIQQYIADFLSGKLEATSSAKQN
ncbi:LCP family protein [Candidatus Daviesbacteria bacterium]|nr:LCP family protein [Candidatus Daviesbacteria bacterium]